MTVDPTAFLLLNEDVGASYEAVVRTAAQALGAETCSLALYDATTDELVARRRAYAAAGQPVPQFRFPLDVAPASARVVRTGEPYLCNTPASDPLYHDSVRDNGVHSILTTPVRREGRVLALLYALNKPGGFTGEDVDTALGLADAIGVTLENIQLYDEERRRRLLSDCLREISRTLVVTTSEEVAFGSVLDQLWRVVLYQASIALTVDGDHLRSLAVRGMSAPALPVALADCPEVRSVMAGTTAARLTSALPLGLPEHAEAVLAAPLRSNSGRRGLLVAAFGHRDQAGPRQQELLGIFADHAALFLEAGDVVRRERQARVRSAAVARITRLAAQRLDAAALLRAACPELLSVAGADRAVAYVRHHVNPVLIPVADAGLGADEASAVRDLRLELDAGPLASLAALRPAVLGPTSAVPVTQVVPLRRAAAMLALPLGSHEGAIGAVLLAWVERDPGLDAGTLEMLQDLAGHLALGVENARLVDELARRATTDELTDLANRRRFTEFLNVEMARARRTGGTVALFMADLDHLKQINDTHGHAAGDEAIRHVANVLRRGARLTDCAARLGGEEFALVLSGAGFPGALVKADRLREEIAAEPLPVVGRVTVSCGIAVYPDEAASASDLMRLADARLYEAKRGGRNRVCWG